MGSLLANLSSKYDSDDIGISDGRQAMSNHDGGAVSTGFLDRSLNVAFALGVKCGSGLVEKQNLGSEDEIAEGDIVTNTHAEKNRFLADHRDLPSEASKVVFRDWDTIDGDRAFYSVVKSLQEPDDRRLATTAGSNQCGRLSSRNMKTVSISPRILLASNPPVTDESMGEGLSIERKIVAAAVVPALNAWKLGAIMATEKEPVMIAKSVMMMAAIPYMRLTIHIMIASIIPVYVLAFPLHFSATDVGPS
ncbi:hypothetical protein KC320_g172 [Hortaea werneckii]|nr:hypothetical protein KC320_g172 [Hortaea werneckii]